MKHWRVLTTKTNSTQNSSKIRFWWNRGTKIITRSFLAWEAAYEVPDKDIWGDRMTNVVVSRFKINVNDGTVTLTPDIWKRRGVRYKAQFKRQTASNEDRRDE